MTSDGLQVRKLRFVTCHSSPSSPGFTLIEIMIAMAILAMISVLIYTSTSQTIKGKEETVKRDESNHSVSLALNKMAADLQTAFILNSPDLLGSEGRIKTVFSGKEDKLDFAALSHTRYFKNTREADFAEVGYYLADDPEDSSKKILMRRESKLLDDKPEEGGSADPMVEGVKDFRLEYYDPKKKEWLKSWDSSQLEQSNRLPRAVRIEIKIENPEEEEPQTFSTIAELKLYAPINL